jgi:hypothetical protein
MKAQYTMGIDQDGRRRWYAEGLELKALPIEFALKFEATWPIGTRVVVEMPGPGDDRLERRFRALLEKKVSPADRKQPLFEEALNRAVGAMMEGNEKARNRFEARLIELGLAVEQPDGVDSEL